MVQSAEYQAVMDERARLAREIHDGVAQTLGYLKLLAAQLENNLARGETARINQLMEISRSALAEAYVDARQAIDGLRITPENGFGSWIQQAANDFTSNTGMKISVETDRFPATVPPEVQAQLIRIVQEALTNIRKHAGAHQVWIQGGVRQGDLVMEVRDNGMGFEPEDVIRPSRHGLRGMQERAELIDAEFQIISSPGIGTTIRVRLPGSVMELTP
jgi:two-component system nitrate/nitrite sensor histidine kinase NarX